MAQALTPKRLDSVHQSFLYSAPSKHIVTGKDNYESNKASSSTKLPPRGRLIALDLGLKRVGVAVSDELQITVRPLPVIERASWKKLLRAVRETIESFDARGLVIGLPLNLNGTEGFMSEDARRLTRNFELSLGVPVFLQDERLTSLEAEETLRAEGCDAEDIGSRIDSASACIILRDFLAQSNEAKKHDGSVAE